MISDLGKKRMRIKRSIILPTLFLLMLAFFAIDAQAYGPNDLQVPSDAEAIVYGTSGAGRNLTAYRFGTGKNVMVLGFAIHGFEDNWKRDGEALVYTAGRLMNLLHENAWIIRDYDWTVYVLPCMNPDGLLDGYTNNGPGRCTTRYYNGSGALVSGGLDLNRSFPYNWVRYTNSRNFNGTQPLAAKEAKALAAFLKSVKGSGKNVLIDAHGWETSIISMEGASGITQELQQAFPGNKLIRYGNGSGYFAAYAQSLGYHSCLFEFPGGMRSLLQFQNSGWCERFNNCIPRLLMIYGTYSPRATVQVQAEGPGTVQGAGTFLLGSTVTVLANANPGARFLGWYNGDQRVSDQAECRFSLGGSCTLTAKFMSTVSISVTPSRSGTVSGTGAYLPGETVTLVASSYDVDIPVKWYSGSELIATGPVYQFTAAKDTQLSVLFGDDVFVDISQRAWYLDAVMDAHSLGITNGVTEILFDPSASFTRAMAAVMLYRMDGPEDLNRTISHFDDVPQGKYYSVQVAWAEEHGIVNGVSQTRFAPKAEVTRQQFVTMLVRYLKSKGWSATPSEIAYSDQSEIDGWAMEAVRVAQTMGLIQGYADGTFRPDAPLKRSEGTALIIRSLRYMETHEKQTNSPDES